MSTRKPTLAVWKFASCDGCQLSLLACEDELLAIAEVIEIANFAEASRRYRRGPYDLSLVEGSIATARDRARIQEVRRQSKHLVTLGACATAGGIQALRNGRSIDEFLAVVYAQPDYIDALATSTPIAHHVAVDFELRGCPIDKGQLLEVVSALLLGRRPQIPTHSVCIDCKARGRVCVMVVQGKPCLGPVTQTGCGALCPAYGRPCYGCFGPMEAANVAALANQWRRAGCSTAEMRLALQSFNAAAPAFARGAQALDDTAGDTHDDALQEPSP